MFIFVSLNPMSALAQPVGRVVGALSHRRISAVMREGGSKRGPPFFALRSKILGKQYFRASPHRAPEIVKTKKQSMGR